MHFIAAADIRHLLSFPVLVDALEAAHRRPKIQVDDKERTGFPLARERTDSAAA